MKKQILNVAIFGFTMLCITTTAAETAQGAKSTLEVLCQNKIDRRVIQRNNNNVWCDTIFTNICDRNREKAARLVCTQKYEARLNRNKGDAEITQKGKKTTPTKIQKEEKMKSQKRTALENELQEIEFEIQRINLRQRELDILLRELDLIQKEESFKRG